MRFFASDYRTIGLFFFGIGQNGLYGLFFFGASDYRPMLSLNS